MSNNSFAEREAQRLLALRDLKILDTPPEEAYERVTALAAQLFEVPVSLVSLVDENRQWFKSCFGGDLLGARETGRDIAFCAHAVEADDLLVVPDATLDARFVDNPLVTGTPGIRFYAGAPLRSPDGYALGTLCLIDFVPREFSEKERDQLRALAEIVSSELKHRRAAQEAQSSEHRLRTLIENTSDVISILDAQGTIRYESPAITELLGYTPEELLGQSAFALVHPDDHAILGEAFQRVANGEKQVAPVEFRFLHRDGNWRVLEAIGRSRLDDPDLSGIVVSSRDITARREAQRILRESEENLRLALEAGQMGVWKADLKTRQVQLSPQLEKIHGLALDGDASFAQFMRCVHPDDRALLQRCALQAIETGREFITEYRALRPDGSTNWFEVRGVPFRGADGAVATLTGVSIDISERRAAEDALRVSEARKAAIVETALDCIITIDGESRILEWNPAAERTFGYTSAEAMSKPLYELIMPSELRAAHQSGMRNYLATGNSTILGRRLEMPALHADGSQLMVEVAIVSISEADPPLFTGHLRDITALKAAEAERRRDATRIANVLESITDAFFSVDKDWRFTYINDQAVRVLARRREDLLGRNLWDEFPDAVDSIFQREYSRAIESGAPVSFEEFSARLNAWLAFHAYPSEEGLSVYFSGRDGQARRAGRFAGSAQRSGAPARKRRERANDAKSEFFVAHEPRTAHAAQRDSGLRSAFGNLRIGAGRSRKHRANHGRRRPFAEPDQRSARHRAH